MSLLGPCFHYYTLSFFPLRFYVDIVRVCFLRSIIAYFPSPFVFPLSFYFHCDRKYLRVVLLTKEDISICVDVKAKGQEVLDKVCLHLGLRESEFFGLALRIADEYQFIR